MVCYSFEEKYVQGVFFQNGEIIYTRCVFQNGKNKRLPNIYIYIYIYTFFCRKPEIFSYLRKIIFSYSNSQNDGTFSINTSDYYSRKYHQFLNLSEGKLLFFFRRLKVLLNLVFSTVDFYRIIYIYHCPYRGKFWPFLKS